MFELLKEYRDMIKISRLNQLQLEKSKLSRTTKIALIDGPLDERRTALCKEYQNVSFDNTLPTTILKENSPAIIHCCAIFDRIQGWIKNSDIYVITIFEEELKTSAKALFNAIAKAVNSNVDVVNVSVGIDDLSEEVQTNMKQVCDYAEKQGVIIVAASKAKQQIIPAIFNNVVAVRGENLGAPGVFFTETKPAFCVIAHGGTQAVQVNGKIHLIEGSSFATAEISGIIACLIAKHGRMPLMECRKLLMQQANDIW